jgi:hypothetical protein
MKTFVLAVTALAAVLLVACVQLPAPGAAPPPTVMDTPAAPAPDLSAEPPDRAASPTPMPPPTMTPFPPGYIAPPTYTPGPSPTSRPSGTPPVATIVPPIVALPAGQLPPITRDVFFLNRFTLLRWDHLSGQLEVLSGGPSGRAPGGAHRAAPAAMPPAGGPQPGDVMHFILRPDGRQLLIWRMALSGDAFEVAALDLDTRDLRVIFPNESYPADFHTWQFSPDGVWLAYIEPDIPRPAGRAPGLSAGRLRPPAGGGPWGLIKAFRLDVPEERIEVGYCSMADAQQQGHCDPFRWSPDSRAIAWSDPLGVWFTEPGQPPRQLIVHEPLPPWSTGDPATTPPRYVVDSWAPSGRFLLLREGWADERYVFDTLTGRRDAVPGSGRLDPNSPPAQSAWTPDGRLYILAAAGDGLLAISRWRIEPDGASLLVREGDARGLGQPGSYPLPLVPRPDGGLAFAIGNNDPLRFDDRGLYVLDPAGWRVRRVNGLPPWISPWHITWLPDGSGAFMDPLDPTGTFHLGRFTIYVPIDGSGPFELRATLGEETCCFHWRP